MLPRVCVPLVSAAACLLTALTVGCGGGRSKSLTDAAIAISPRFDGNVAIAAQTISLVDDAGAPTKRILSVPAVLAAPGQEVNLPVLTSDLSGVAGAAVRLDLDNAALACAEVTSGAWVSPQAQVLGNAAAAALAVAGTETRVSSASATVVATFRLRISPDAVPRDAALPLVAVLTDATGTTLGRTPRQSPASVRPLETSTLIGDLMESGRAEVGSAVRILRVVVGLDAPPTDANRWRWDCNGSGGIDVGDATRLLRCVVGLDTWPIRSSGGNVTVDITPKDVTLAWGEKKPFKATVSGSASQAVTWEVVGSGLGTITADGQYTAPSKDCDVTIRARSVAWPSSEPGTVVVNVRQPGPILLTNGGTVELGGGEAVLLAGWHAVDVDTPLTYERGQSHSGNGIATIMECRITPRIKLKASTYLTLHYKTVPSGIDEGNLHLWCRETASNAWSLLPTDRNKQGDTVSAWITALGEFAVGAPEPPTGKLYGEVGTSIQQIPVAGITIGYMDADDITNTWISVIYLLPGGGEFISLLYPAGRTGDIRLVTMYSTYDDRTVGEAAWTRWSGLEWLPIGQTLWNIDDRYATTGPGSGKAQIGIAARGMGTLQGGSFSATMLCDGEVRRNLYGSFGGIAMDAGIPPAPETSTKSR